MSPRDTGSGRRTATVSGRAAIGGLSFSRDGAFVATAGDDGAARVYSAHTGDRIALLPTRASSLEAIAFSPVGSSLAVAGDDGFAAVLDCVECRPLDELLCLAADGLGEQRAAIDSLEGRCHPR
jgi:WD40 repeat protein